ncbi:ArsR/SmtB family transcription factor [Kocuria flava]|uniref:ArsR/SmtB family transcription factor n=1 Tax=Kocuria flava TaxID=446860 RepID=UPI003F1AD869
MGSDRMGSTDVFAVIADKTRRAILTALKDGERPVGELVAELGVAQPTVSKHLKILREAGMVSMEAQGQRRLYAVEPGPLTVVTEWVQDVVGGQADRPRTPGTDGVERAARPTPETTGTPAGAGTDPGAEPVPGTGTVPAPPETVPAQPVAPAAPEPAAPAGPAAAGPAAAPEPGPELPAAAAPARPGRGAGGLLSTLTGLRRRGKHARR